MKKKTVAAMLVLCMAVSLSACQSSKTETQTSDAQDTADTETGETEEDAGSEEAADTADAEESSDTENTDSSDAGAAFERLVSVDDVSSYVKIGEYKGLSLNRYSVPVTDDIIDAEIKSVLEDAAEEVADGTAQAWDTVRINFTSTINGEAVTDGSKEDYDLLIGNAVFGDDFDNAVIGMKPGETKNISVTYPEDYYDEDVAGQTVDYTVTLQTITRAPELTDEWVSANTDYKTADEYRAAVKVYLEDYYKDSADLQLYSDAWSDVLENCEVKEYPEEDLEKEREVYRSLMEDALKEAGTSLEDFLDAQGMTNDAYEEECETYAKEKVKQNLIVQGVIDAENLTLTDAERDELESLLLQQYGVESIEEITETYGEDEVNASLALLKVERFIVEQATVSEMSGDEDDAVVNEAAYDDEGAGASGESADDTTTDETGSEVTLSTSDTSKFSTASADSADADTADESAVADEGTDESTETVVYNDIEQMDPSDDSASDEGTGADDTVAAEEESAE